MRNLALLSRDLWLPGVARGELEALDGVRSWLVNGEWSLDSEISKGKARINPYNSKDFTQACLYDAIKLSSVAFESINSYGTPRASDDERACAWRLISAYYAAYFSANALMRLAGHSFTNLNVIECAKINEWARLTEMGGDEAKSSLQQGAFYVRPDGKGSVLIDGVKSGGGVHIQFWIAFGRFLDVLRSGIQGSARLSYEKANALKELSELRAGLSYANVKNGSWLSEFRNAVNYRFEYGAWYPYEGGGTTFSEVSNIIKLSMQEELRDLPEIKYGASPVILAANLSSALVAWLRSSLMVIEKTSTGRKKKMISQGPFAYCMV